MKHTALLCFGVYILWLFVRDIRIRFGVSGAVWAVVIWVAMIGSRPVSTWFMVSGGDGGQAVAYDEGSPIERLVYFALIALGLFTLFWRNVSLREIIGANQWLAVFFLYWLCSVVWSDAPLISFKRWVKDVGNLVMVLVLLTEEDPLQAIKAVFARCAYALIPISVLLIMFYGDLGRAYHPWSGEMMYTGVATHKNTLGALVLVCGLFFMWDFLDRFRGNQQPLSWIGLAGDLPLIGMALWLLRMAHSSTALGCAAVGTAVFFGLGVAPIRHRMKNLELYLIGAGVMVWLLNSVFDVKRLVVVDMMGRDLTLTTRTEVWPMLLKQSGNFLLGTGFNSFWSGDRLAVIYKQLGIIQAHNGFLDTYLNGGMVGVTLLLALLFAVNQSVKRELVFEGDYARVRMMFLAVAIMYDFTEAAFNKVGLIWFALLLVAMQYPRWQEDEVAEETDLVIDENADPGARIYGLCKSDRSALILS
jgi:hypothetical protein